METVVWSWCPNRCMDSQDHFYVPGKGWICMNCKMVNHTMTDETESKQEEKDA